MTEIWKKIHNYQERKKINDDSLDHLGGNSLRKSDMDSMNYLLINLINYFNILLI